MIKPYVYKLTHKLTNHFYIGMRSANKVPAYEDIGKMYFSSSKTVRQNFDSYNIEIIKEFDDSESAFIFENELIEENWRSELLLNKHFQRTRSCFSMKGFKRLDVSELNKTRKTKQKETRIYCCRYCFKDFERVEFAHHPVKLNSICSQYCAAKNAVSNHKRGYKISKDVTKVAWNKGLSKETDERILKYSNTLSIIKKGTPAWNKRTPNPMAAENGRMGAAKQSQTVTGRKRKYREDGTWFWEYPKKKQ